MYFSSMRARKASRTSGRVKVIKSGYPSARAYLGLARVRKAISMYASAKRMIDKAHELDPNDPDIQKRGLIPWGRRNASII